MNPVERVIRRVDAWQRRHTASAVTFGVIKKYGDDNAGQLAASLAHAAFVSLFPLLLVLVTVLGIVAADNPGLRQHALSAVTSQFPLMGQQLAGNVHQLRSASIAGLVVGLVIASWGATGLAQSGMFAMAQIWNLPGPARPGYWQRLGRAGIFLCVLALAVASTTALTSLAAFGQRSLWLMITADVLAAVVNVGMYSVGFRVLTPKTVPTRHLLPGAALAGIIWTILQALGNPVVRHFLQSDSAYGIFALVLSLLAWIYLVVQVTVYCAEINVVLVRRLWPRSILQPPLTEADRAALALLPLQNQRREEQEVVVTFSDDGEARRDGAPTLASNPPRVPRVPEDVSPPAAGQQETGAKT